MSEKYSRISKKTLQELLMEFCEALLSVKTPEEAVKFLTDLLTKSEIVMLAKRIKIAKLLIEGKDYRTIERLLEVSHSTISKVARWLEESGEGFRLVAERTKKRKEEDFSDLKYKLSEWGNLKKRYPIVFWPQLLLEEIISTANKSQKERLRKVIEKLDHKSKLYKRLNKILNKR